MSRWALHRATRDLALPGLGTLHALLSFVFTSSVSKSGGLSPEDPLLRLEPFRPVQYPLAGFTTTGVCCSNSYTYYAGTLT